MGKKVEAMSHLNPLCLARQAAFSPAAGRLGGLHGGRRTLGSLVAVRRGALPLPRIPRGAIVIMNRIHAGDGWRTTASGVRIAVNGIANG